MNSAAVMLLALHLGNVEPGLPVEWHGEWKGVCKLIGAARDGDVPMELHLKPLAGGGSTFTIIYGTGEKRQTRGYELKPVNDKPGHFINDEKNGIETDVRLMAGVIHSAFEVDGGLVHSRFELRDGAIHVEMTSFNTKTPRVTKPRGREMTVKSFSLQSVQTGSLKKQ